MNVKMCPLKWSKVREKQDLKTWALMTSGTMSYMYVMYVIGIPEGNRGGGNIWRNSDQNVLNLMEVQWVPSRINTKKSTLRFLIVKILKVKDKNKIWKVVRTKWHIAQRVIIWLWLTSHCTITMEVRRQCNDIFKALKENTVNTEFYI